MERDRTVAVVLRLLAILRTCRAGVSAPQETSTSDRPTTDVMMQERLAIWDRVRIHRRRLSAECVTRREEPVTGGLDGIRILVLVALSLGFRNAPALRLSNAAYGARTYSPEERWNRLAQVSRLVAASADAWRSGRFRTSQPAAERGTTVTRTQASSVLPTPAYFKPEAKMTSVITGRM